MNYRLICGDCLDALKTLEAGSVDAIITDFANLGRNSTRVLCGRCGRGL